MTDTTATDIRWCRTQVLFVDETPCDECGLLNRCLEQPRLTDNELTVALYDHYLAPFFDGIGALLR